ncbi:hypothetical protein RRG08_044233 [Elysia crispata]|uniref:Uncharacterized protein n=1 Tax=Elysia crispata TaxID=231223 RepID=A0AAE0XXP9_9GAST|nr:hypothetical protein RRG08_044233 [Elysia crispata]
MAALLAASGRCPDKPASHVPSIQEGKQVNNRGDLLPGSAVLGGLEKGERGLEALIPQCPPIVPLPITAIYSSGEQTKHGERESRDATCSRLRRRATYVQKIKGK